MGEWQPREWEEKVGLVTDGIAAEIKDPLIGSLVVYLHEEKDEQREESGAARRAPL